MSSTLRWLLRHRVTLRPREVVAERHVEGYALSGALQPAGKRLCSGTSALVPEHKALFPPRPAPISLHVRSLAAASVAGFYRRDMAHGRGGTTSPPLLLAVGAARHAQMLGAEPTPASPPLSPSPPASPAQDHVAHCPDTPCGSLSVISRAVSRRRVPCSRQPPPSLPPSPPALQLPARTRERRLDPATWRHTHTHTRAREVRNRRAAAGTQRRNI